jgi:hypothetical protein
MRHVAAVAAALALTIAGTAIAADPIEMEVAWTHEKCDFIVTKNAAGHGIAMRLTPLTLAAGDVLSGSLDAVGYGRKIVKVGTDEAAMMQIRKYGIRRKVAFDFIYDWSRHCNPPEE